jgi:hypothetical protein
MITNFPDIFLIENDLNIFCYSRTNSLPTGGVTDMGTFIANAGQSTRISIRDNNSDRCIGTIKGAQTIGTNTNSQGGYHLNGIVGASASKLVKNGSTTLVNITSGSFHGLTHITLGGTLNGAGAIQLSSSRNYAGAAIGLSLTDTQIQDDYTIWQQFQTDFNGRQV